MNCMIQGIRIHVLEAEANPTLKEPSLLFIHGAGGDAAIWDAQASFFRGRNPIYRLDLPGHGLSWGQGEDDIAAYAEWAHNVIDTALPPHDWVVVGHSMGGAVALQLALDHPASLKGLVLACTGAKLGVLPAIIKMLETDAQAFFKTIELAAFCSDTPAEVREIASRSILKCPPQVTLKDFHACNRFDIRQRLQEIDTPSLIACGEKDRLTPVKHSEYLHRYLRNSRLVLIPDAGHMVMAEKPDAFNKALIEFLDEISKRDE